MKFDPVNPPPSRPDRHESPRQCAPTEDLVDFDARIGQALDGAASFAVRGRVSEVLGNLIKASGIRASIGEVCTLTSRRQGRVGLAEVVGFSNADTFLSPVGPVSALSPDVEVSPLGRTHRIAVGDTLLGRVLDGFGEPLDGRTSLAPVAVVQVDRAPPNPLDRQPIDVPFETGFRAIDTLLACGVGQRLGIFAPAGVGKSTLLGELAGRSSCDVNVIALVGERGREVGDFVRNRLTTEARRRTVIIAATSDRSAMERVRAGQVATAIAEFFRDQGRHVMLLVDSLTRLARAQREIGLAVGEPPTRRGFPPSVFSMLPRLLERSGPSGTGCITAFYTVLTEGDEQDDPVAEEVQAILDGHLQLSRVLSAAGQFPAIDLLASNSRLIEQVLPEDRKALVAEARALLARFEEVRLLLQIGEYRKGLDERTDRAIELQPALQRFFHQPLGSPAVNAAASFAALGEILASRR